jgi:hypothetical protein
MTLVWIGIGLLALLGAPLFVVIGSCALLGFYGSEIPGSAVIADLSLIQDGWLVRGSRCGTRSWVAAVYRDTTRVSSATWRSTSGVRGAGSDKARRGVLGTLLAILRNWIPRVAVGVVLAGRGRATYIVISK